MRVAVYQQHLTTMGGGERYALDAARVVARAGHEVDVLVPPGSSLDAVGERLGVEVGGLQPVELSDWPPDDRDASRRSGAYDAFLNFTHWSRAVNRAPYGAYVCHFPQAAAEPVAAARAREPGGKYAHAVVTPSVGLVPDPERGWWTDGHAWLDVTRSGRGTWVLHLWLAPRHRAWRGGARHVEVRLDGRCIRRVRVPRTGRPLSLLLPPATVHSHHHVELVSEAEQSDMAGRPLGVHVRRARLSAPGLRVEPQGRTPTFLCDYDVLLASGSYSAEWMRRRWDVEAHVVPPAVSALPVPSGTRRGRSIVVVGRFFTGGHSKRQLELVEAFNRMCDSGLEGWTLHLMGNVDPVHARYVELVRRMSAGRPVVVETGASREQLGRRLGEASILWQATGWGEDPDRHPERFEHFGISTVEAMAAGVVPVALGIGGVTGIVRDGVDGVLWRKGPEEATRALIDDPARLAAMSAAARERAREFGRDAFEARLGRILSWDTAAA